MKSYTVEQYRQAGCEEMSNQAMFAVWGITGGKVCDTGCHAFDMGKCPFYKKLTADPVKKPKKSDVITNKEFAKSSKAFFDACEKANVKPTTRQASKFRNGKGAAFKASKRSVKV